MSSFKISEYLNDRDKKKNQGTCRACLKEVAWSRCRVESHKRMNCPAATDEEKRKFSKRPASALNSSNQSELNSSFVSTQSIEIECSSCNLSDGDIKNINVKLANFFYRTGISFRLADSEAFKDFISSLNPSYAASMPSAKMLSGSLLDQQYVKCSNRLEETLAAAQNLTLVTDGWTNIRGDHLVNFCIKAPELQPLFYKSINTSGISQNSQAVAAAIIEVIEELGSEKFCCVVTDNAPVMKAAWRHIEERFPHISANGCTAHCMSLLLKDLSNTPEHAKTIKDSEKVIKFVNNHHIVKAKYEAMRISAKIPRTLSLSVSTRWFSLFNSMNDLLFSKYVLIQLADEENDLLAEIAPKTTSAAVLSVIKSNTFWASLAKLVKDIEFPANIIGKFEADNAPLSNVYHYFGELYNHFEHDKIAQTKVKKRLDFLYTECIGLAYMLTPKFAAQGFYFAEDKIDIVGSAENFASKIVPDIAEDTAEEVGREMIAYVGKMSSLTEFRGQTIFKMSAKEYWNIIGHLEFPSLYKIAKTINEMICSSATAERAWSTFRFIHSRLRNRLTNDRVKKLVFIYTNCALLDENDKNDYILEDGAVLDGNECEEPVE